MSDVEKQIKAAAVACSTPGGVLYVFGLCLLACAISAAVQAMLGG